MATQCTILAQAFQMLQAMRNDEYMLVEESGNMILMAYAYYKFTRNSGYPTISQVFGIPLDSRHSYTESDWELWTAAICASATRRLFVNAVAYWLNNTSTDRAFTDLYETIDDGSYPASPDSIHFIARPVAGGHFSLLALLKAG